MFVANGSSEQQHLRCWLCESSWGQEIVRLLGIDSTSWACYHRRSSAQLPASDRRGRPVFLHQSIRSWYYVKIEFFSRIISCSWYFERVVDIWNAPIGARCADTGQLVVDGVQRPVVRINLKRGLIEERISTTRTNKMQYFFFTIARGRQTISK